MGLFPGEEFGGFAAGEGGEADGRAGGIPSGEGCQGECLGDSRQRQFRGIVVFAEMTEENVLQERSDDDIGGR